MSCFWCFVKISKPAKPLILKYIMTNRLLQMSQISNPFFVVKPWGVDFFTASWSHYNQTNLKCNVSLNMTIFVVFTKKPLRRLASKKKAAPRLILVLSHRQIWLELRNANSKIWYLIKQQMIIKMSPTLTFEENPNWLKKVNFQGEPLPHSLPPNMIPPSLRKGGPQATVAGSTPTAGGTPKSDDASRTFEDKRKENFNKGQVKSPTIILKSFLMFVFFFRLNLKGVAKA